MNLFPNYNDRIPKNRLELVTDLDIPDDITLTPYTWMQNEDIVSPRSDSLLSYCSEESDRNTLSTETSLALSRAMTDSEIDYSFYRRFKKRSFSDPWLDLRIAIDAFPPGYISSLNSFCTSTSELTEDSIIRDYERQTHYSEELRLKMEKYFEDIRVFMPDDPTLIHLEEALDSMDAKETATHLDSVTP